MKLRPHELLRLAEPYLSEGLVSIEARRRLARLRGIPPVVAGIGALECRLEEKAERVDFELCVGARQRHALAALLDDERWRAAAAENAGWRRASRFLREWSTPGTVLFECVQVVWLEFDLKEMDAPIRPAPFVVLTLTRECSNREAAHAPMAVVEHGLRTQGVSIDGQAWGMLRRSLSSLPATARVLHAAARPDSEGDLIRLILRLPWRSLVEYLDRVGWPGSASDLATFLEKYCARTLMHSVNLDVGTGVAPALGLEFHFPSSPLADPRWISMLNLLVADGACTPEKRRIVSRWPHRADDAPSGNRRRPPLLRELMVKVVYTPGKPLRAKAYLPFGPPEA